MFPKAGLFIVGFLGIVVLLSFCIPSQGRRRESRTCPWNKEWKSTGLRSHEGVQGGLVFLRTQEGPVLGVHKESVSPRGSTQDSSSSKPRRDPYRGSTGHRCRRGGPTLDSCFEPGVTPPRPTDASLVPPEYSQVFPPKRTGMSGNPRHVLRVREC